MASYPCTDDPREIIDAIVGAGENAEKFDKFVNGGVYEEVQLGAGEPTPTLRNLSHLVKSAAATLDGSDVSGKFSDAANGGETLRMLADRFGDLVNVKDFGAIGDGVTDDTAAIQNAMDTGKDVFLPSGIYVVSDTLAVETDGQRIYGAGKGFHRMHFYAPQYDREQTTIMVKGTGTKAVRTRANYRAAASDPKDDPLSVAVNILASGVQFSDFCLSLYCDYTDDSTSNFGDNYDVGFFVSSQQETAFVDVDVVGYWRKAAVYIDSTAADNLPALFGTVRQDMSGADGTTLVRCVVCGGRWAIVSQGGKPKTGLLRRGSTYAYAGSISLSAVPSNNDTITIDTETFTFKTSPLNEMDVEIGNTAAASLANFFEVWRTQGLRMAVYDDITFDISGASATLYAGNEHTISAASSAVSVQAFLSISDPALYYDEDTGLVPDYRGTLGASDLVIDNCVLYSIEHHSHTPITSPDALETAYTDNCAGVVYISGIGGAAVIHRQFFHHTRFHSREPYTVKLDLAGRVRLLDCTFDGEATDSYGRLVANPLTTGRIQQIGYDDLGDYFARGESSNQVYTHFYLDAYRGVFHNRVDISKALFLYANGNYSGIRSDDKNIELLSRVSLSNMARMRIGNSGTFEFTDLKEAGNLLYMNKNAASFYVPVKPNSDNTLSLGAGNARFSVVYAGTGSINTSDEREKTSIASIDDSIFRAWEKVKYKIFQFKDAVSAKGSEGARLHAGLLAQDVKSAFESEGLDASRYGLFCYDEWEDQYEDVEVVDSEAVFDEHGEEIVPAKTHMETRLAQPAGDRYGIRYDEALALECAYQRRRFDQLESRLAAVEAKLASMETQQ